ncbi:unnamed protein product, partial [Taenia asiatica]|uniref:SEA domain-containing protein n=1 Tax=Taenia asiatica TaxID=60517 RepID=A0A158RA91_TAEAS
EEEEQAVEEEKNTSDAVATDNSHDVDDDSGDSQPSFSTGGAGRNSSTAIGAQDDEDPVLPHLNHEGGTSAKAAPTFLSKRNHAPVKYRKVSGIMRDMGLHFSLLASIAAITAWVIRTENGGLLNVLFRIVLLPKGREPEFDLIANVDAPVVEFFRKMLLLQPPPVPILQVIPESLGGGQVAVDNAYANPNRGPDIFWITVSSFLLSVVLIILIQTINCSRCCCKEKDMQGSMNALQMALLRSNFINKQYILRMIYVVVLVLTLVFLAVSISLLMVYFSSTGLVVAYLATNPQPSVGNQTPVSLPDGLRATVLHASSFVGKRIAEGRVLTSRTLHDFANQIYASLLRFTPGSAKYTGKVMRGLLNLLFDIYGYFTLLYNETASLETKLDAVRIAFTQVLGSVSNCSHWDLCKGLNATIASIAFPISSGKLNPKLIASYIEGLNQITVSLFSPMEEVRGSINELRNSTNDILNSLKSELDITHILDQIEAFWDAVQSRAGKSLNQLNNTVNSVEAQLHKHVHNIRVGFIIVGAVFMVILIITTLIAMRLVYRAIHNHLHAHPNTVSIGEECIYLERESAVKMSDFVVNGYMARQWKTLIGDAVGGSADFLNTPPPKNILLALTQTCNGGTSQHPVGLLSALGYRNLVNVSKLVNSPDLTQAIERGRQAIMEQVRGLSVSGSLPNGAKTGELRRELNEKIAKFSLAELVSDTNPTNMIASLVEQILEGIQNLTTYASITNGTSSRPNEVLAEALESARKIKLGFEQTHQSLKQLDSRKWDILGPLDDLISALNVSSNFYLEAFTCENSCFLFLLKPLLPRSIAFQAAEGDEFTQEVEKEYDNLAANLMDYMRADGEATFAQLTASLFPCQEAHTAYSLAIGVTCGETGGVHLLIGLSYILALNVLFLTFLFFALFTLAFFQALQIRMLNDIAGGDDDDSISKHRIDCLLLSLYPLRYLQSSICVAFDEEEKEKEERRRILQAMAIYFSLLASVAAKMA